MPDDQDYAGPAILSRGQVPTVRRAGELVRLTPYATITGSYDTGLAVTSVDQNGNLVTADTYGVVATFGVTGTHTWKRTILDLDYRGSFRHYSQKTYFDGFDNSLILNVGHQINRHVSVQFSENASRYSQQFFLPVGLAQGYDPTYSALTSNSLFDTPTNVAMTSGQLSYQHSLRTSFSMGGTAFIVRPQGQALVGVNGYSARGGTAYRLSRYRTLSVDYTFSHYDFTRAFGTADIHSISVGYSERIGRFLEIGLSAGGFRAEAKSLQTVALDPAVALILGYNTGIQTYDRVTYSPQFGVHLTRKLPHAVVGLSYNRTAMPGNGVYLTSTYDTVNATYTHSTSRRTSAMLNGGFSSYHSLSQTLGTYRNYFAGGGFTYKMSRVFSLLARIDGRRYQIEASAVNNPFRRTFYRASLGIGISPGDYPLSLW